MLPQVSLVTALILTMSLVSGSDAPDDARPFATIQAGSDADISRYVTWIDAKRELHILGVAGAEVVIDEALVILVARNATDSRLATWSTLPQGSPALALEARHNGRPLGRIELGAPASLPIGTLRDGDVVSLGMRVRSPMDVASGPSIVHVALEALTAPPRG